MFQREVQRGDIHLETISKSMVFTATEVETILLRVDEKRRPEG